MDESALQVVREHHIDDSNWVNIVKSDFIDLHYGRKLDFAAKMQLRNTRTVYMIFFSFSL